MINTATPASVSGLTKHYGDVAVVNNVSFDIRPGAITGFLGPNGAGKTTTLRMLMGLTKPTAGTALINGQPFRHLAEPAQHAGAVLESGDFHPGRTGRNHLRTLARTADIDEAKVDKLLDVVGLGQAARKQVGGYSLGMRQRLGIASALLGDPALLILDEPANGLDPVGIRWLRTLLTSITEAGGAVLMSSHLLNEAAQTVDHVLIIHDGQLVANEPLENLVGDGQSLEQVYLDIVDHSARHTTANALATGNRS